MSEENNVGNAVLYEVINIHTGVVEPVEKLGSGDTDGDQDADFIVHKEDGTEIIFKREGQDEAGNAKFANPDYLVRDRETHLAPNGVDHVGDIVVGPEKSAEVVADGQATE